MSPTYTLQPVSFGDGPGMAQALERGFADDQYHCASFPRLILEEKIEGVAARWPANFNSPGVLYMKTVHEETQQIVGCSKWKADAELTNLLKEKFGTNVAIEGAERLERRDPVGLNDELTSEMSAKMVACRTSVLGDRPRIILSLLTIMPEHLGQGLGSKHVQWGIQLADKTGLPFWLDASPMSVPVYARLGFKVVGEVQSDLSLGSEGAASGMYIHTCMLREPQKTHVVSDREVSCRNTERGEQPTHLSVPCIAAGS